LSISKTLDSLNAGGRPPTDQDMLKWALDAVKNSKSPNRPNPPTKPIRSFKDPSISDGLFFLDLLDALRPGIVDYSMVVRPANEYEVKRQNGARRDLSCAMANSDTPIAQQNLQSLLPVK